MAVPADCRHRWIGINPPCMDRKVHSTSAQTRRSTCTKTVLVALRDVELDFLVRAITRTTMARTLRSLSALPSFEGWDVGVGSRAGPHRAFHLVSPIVRYLDLRPRASSRVRRRRA